MFRWRSFLILLTLMLLPMVGGGCGRKIPLPDYYREPFPAASGKQIRIIDLDARIVLLFFWTRDCIPCASIEPEIRKTATLLKGKVAILGVNTDTGESMEEPALPGSGNTEPPPSKQLPSTESYENYQFNGDSIQDPDFQLVQELQVETAPALVVLYDDGEQIHLQWYYNLERLKANDLAEKIRTKLKEK